MSHRAAHCLSDHLSSNNNAVNYCRYATVFKQKYSNPGHSRQQLYLLLGVKRLAHQVKSYGPPGSKLSLSNIDKAGLRCTCQVWPDQAVPELYESFFALTALAMEVCHRMLCDHVAGKVEKPEAIKWDYEGFTGA